LARAAVSPKQFPLGLKDTRRAVLHHFPYVVIFRPTDQTIDVVAFFHTSRDPTIWKNRA
jgi:plasmid stabilization system protein ParE